jgi:Tfp pilus assembly protein PilF
MVLFNINCSNSCSDLKKDYNEAYKKLDFTNNYDSLVNIATDSIPNKLASFLKLYAMKFQSENEFLRSFDKLEPDLNSTFYWTLKSLATKDSILMQSYLEKAIKLDKCELNRYARFELSIISRAYNPTKSKQLLVDLLNKYPFYAAALEEDFFERVYTDSIDEKYILKLQEMGNNGCIHGYNLLGKYYELFDNFNLAKVNYELALSLGDNSKSYLGLGNINKKNNPDAAIYFYNKAANSDSYSSETANFLVAEVYEQSGPKFNIDSAIKHLQVSISCHGELYIKAVEKMLVLLIYTKRYSDADVKVSLYEKELGRTRDYLFFKILISHKRGNQQELDKYVSEYKERFNTPDNLEWLRGELSSWEIILN